MRPLGRKTRKKPFDSDGDRRFIYIWTREAGTIDPYTLCNEGVSVPISRAGPSTLGDSLGALKLETNTETPPSTTKRHDIVIFHDEQPRATDVLATVASQYLKRSPILRTTLLGTAKNAHHRDSTQSPTSMILFSSSLWSSSCKTPSQNLRLSPLASRRDIFLPHKLLDERTTTEGAVACTFVDGEPSIAMHE